MILVALASTVALAGNTQKIPYNDHVVKRVVAEREEWMDNGGLWGNVTCQVTQFIDRRGRVSSVHEDCDDALAGVSRSAAWEWTFEPLIVDGKAVRSRHAVTFRFVGLHERPSAPVETVPGPTGEASEVITVTIPGLGVEAALADAPPPAPVPTEPLVTWTELKRIPTKSAGISRPVMEAMAREHVHMLVCIMDVTLSADGSVKDAVAHDCPAFAARYTKEEVMSWRFEPFQVDGVPAAVRFRNRWLYRLE